MDNKKVIASYGLSNTASINIYEIINGIDDSIIAGLNDRKPRQYRIYNTNKGSYFNWGKNRIYLNECMRLDF